MHFNVLKHSEEKIIWKGKPEYKPFLILALIGFLKSVAFLIFAWTVFITFSRIGSYDLSWTLMYVIAFTVICDGLYRFLKKILRYRKIAYCITNQRVYFQYGVLKSQVKEIEKNKIIRVNIEINKIERKYNVGTILIDFGKKK